jgi:hypothetical protein
MFSHFHLLEKQARRTVSLRSMVEDWRFASSEIGARQRHQIFYQTLRAHGFSTDCFQSFAPIAARFVRQRKFFSAANPKVG